MARLTSLEKGIELLRIVAIHPNGCRMATLTGETGIPRTSIVRLLAQLERSGLIERDPSRQKYLIGPTVGCFASQRQQRKTLPDFAENTLSWLADKTAETNYLSLRVGLDALCVARHDGSTPIRAVTLQVGDRRPLGIGAASTAILSALPDDEVKEIVGLNRDRIASGLYSQKAVWSMIEATRQRGVATHESESVPGVICFGVPIRNALGRAIAAASLSFVADQTPKRDRERYESLLIDTAERLEQIIKAPEDTTRSRFQTPTGGIGQRISA